MWSVKFFFEGENARTCPRRMCPGDPSNDFYLGKNTPSGAQLMDDKMVSLNVVINN